jgi:glyoxylase-like metal-dependent hydrolase (beta-lactamase superfamily II)
MCDVSRRKLLLGGVALSSAAPAQTRTEGALPPDVNRVDEIAEGVYFHRGDLENHGHCNNGWIIFKDYVLVIDANFPSGAHLVIPKIRRLTNKPIRFAFDTHHHGDHAYGNQVWVENGATPLAHTGVLEEMKRYETGYFGGQPGRWEEAAKTRPDVAQSRLNPPSLLFPKELYFDDGVQRVELIHFGVAHTHGDAFAWLPKQRILFTGDACVNGPYNYMGDGDSEKWIATLEAAKRLGAQLICPGHGSRGDGAMIDDQQAFFRSLRREVNRLVRAKKTPREVYQSVETIRSALAADKQIARYVGRSLAAQVEKVYQEMTGRGFPPETKTAQAAREHHRRQHARAWA